MRLDIVNHSSHPDAPVGEMYRLVGGQLWNFAEQWPGTRRIVEALDVQGFYLDLVDDLPEAPNALGYHSVDSDGRPFAKVAVNPSLQAGSDWLRGTYSVVAVVGHEALETVLDPLCNRWIVRHGDGDLVAQEACDAVQGYTYKRRGADVTNWLTPAWFNPYGRPPFDFLHVLDRPFQLGDGGYTLKNQGGHVGQEFAAAAPPEWRQHGTRAAIRLSTTPQA